MGVTSLLHIQQLYTIIAVHNGRVLIYTTSQEEPSDFRDEEGEIEEFVRGKRHMKSKGNLDMIERKSTNSLHKATQLLNVHSWVSEQK